MSPESTSAPGADERVGSYVLVRRIGSGGMGEVWLGRHAISGGLGAVKRLSPDAARRAHIRAYFAREGRAIARLAHPHIVPVFEIGEAYLVTAFIDGSNLARRLQTPIDPGAAVMITAQIAAALDHAHASGVVHRDVKPSNILLDALGNAYLADFGVAAIADEDDVDHRVAGTPQFMAPEQKRGARPTPAVDQYALGRTLLEMLVGGRVPVDRDAALVELPQTLPTPLRDAIARATAIDPAARFPSVAAFAEAVAAVELSRHAAPKRLAAISREAAPFAWAAGAHQVDWLGADQARADYRLATLASRGQLAPARVRALLDDRGLADLGFSVYGNTSRLGALTEPEAWARAAEIVVLLHGWSQNRTVWDGVARAVSRDNAQALVICPDVHGFGETRFVRVPTREQASLAAVARTIHTWRSLLGLLALPTVLVGHSMSCLGLLAVGEYELGDQVSRLLINPVMMSHDRALQRRYRAWALGVRIADWIPGLRELTLRRRAENPTWRAIAPEIRATVIGESVRMPPPVMARLLSTFADTPRLLARQRRVAVLVCADDPIHNPVAVNQALADCGVPAAQIHTLATGGHFPHLEDARHPEYTARNVAEIVHEIDSMMLTARESSHASSGTAMGSTVASGPTRTM